MRLSRLKQLRCCYNQAITDRAIMCLTRLTCLHCDSCQAISDASIALIRLERLYCTDCRNITLSKCRNMLNNLIVLDCSRCVCVSDDSLCDLKCVTRLICNYCPLVTDRSIERLSGLVWLECCRCTDVTDRSIRLLTQLTGLAINQCVEITNRSIECLTKLRSLRCYSNHLTDCCKLIAGMVRLTSYNQFSIVNENKVNMSEHMLCNDSILQQKFMKRVLTRSYVVDKYRSDNESSDTSNEYYLVHK